MHHPAMAHASPESAPRTDFRYILGQGARKGQKVEEIFFAPFIDDRRGHSGTGLSRSDLVNKFPRIIAGDRSDKLRLFGVSKVDCDAGHAVAHMSAVSPEKIASRPFVTPDRDAFICDKSAGIDEAFFYKKRKIRNVIRTDVP